MINQLSGSAHYSGMKKPAEAGFWGSASIR